MNTKRGSLGYAIKNEDRDSLKKGPDAGTVLRSYRKRKKVPRNLVGKPFSVVNCLDQVAQGACQGHALALIFSICYFLEFGQVLDFSRAAAYYLSQEYDGLLGRDVGSTLSAGRKVARAGLCLEADWPYPSGYQPQRPASATPDKFIYKLLAATEFEKTEDGFQLMMDWIREGLPVQTGIFWNNSTDAEVIKRYMWSQNDGGHSTVLWLFDSYGNVNNNNSWGDDWCQDGTHTWLESALREAFFVESNVFVGYAPDDLDVPNPEVV